MLTTRSATAEMKLWKSTQHLALNVAFSALAADNESVSRLLSGICESCAYKRWVLFSNSGNWKVSVRVRISRRMDCTRRLTSASSAYLGFSDT